MVETNTRGPLDLRPSTIYWLIAAIFGVFSCGVGLLALRLAVRSYPARIDVTGVILRDGRRFRWADATGLNLVMDTQTGEMTPTFPAVVLFAKEKVVFQPLMLDPAEEFRSRMFPILEAIRDRVSGGHVSR